MKKILVAGLALVVVVGAAEAATKKHSKHFHKAHKQAEAPAEAAPVAAEPAPVVQEVAPPPPPPPPAPAAVEDEAHLTATLELLYLKPHFGGNAAFLTHIDNGAVDNHPQTDFDFDYELSPRLALGWGKENGVGIRGRYFRFSGDADTIAAIDAGGTGAGTINTVIQTAAPGGLGFFSNGVNSPLQTTVVPFVAGAATGFTSTTRFDAGLDIDSFDLEASWNATSGRTIWNLAAGARYLELDQSYTALESRNDTGVLISALHSRSNFEGVGPTIAADARVPLGDGNLSLVGGGRASVLFGDGQQNVVLGVLPTGGRGVFTWLNDTNDVLPIGELDLALEWRGDVQGHSSFFQVGVNAQTYFGAGNSGNAEDIAPRATVGGGTINRQADVDAADSNQNLSLVGFKLAGGLKF